VLPKQLFDSIVKTKRLQPDPRVTAYNRQRIKVVGQQRNVVYNGNQLQVPYVIAHEVYVPVLGLPSCKQLNVVTLVNSVEVSRELKRRLTSLSHPTIDVLLNKFATVFKGIGKIPAKRHIHIKQGAVPVVCTA
jgi:hypothetical protein